MAKALIYPERCPICDTDNYILRVPYDKDTDTISKYFCCNCGFTEYKNSLKEPYIAGVSNKDDFPEIRFKYYIGEIRQFLKRIPTWNGVWDGSKAGEFMIEQEKDYWEILYQLPEIPEDYRNPDGSINPKYIPERKD